jgi:hypothetical protein
MAPFYVGLIVSLAVLLFKFLYLLYDMGLAFEMTRLALGLADRGDIANKLIAKRIIELAKDGQRNPDLLCEGALDKLRDHLYGD